MSRPDHYESPIRFFSRLAGLATHDLKNFLAIINENAGLMEDLSMLADKGRPLEPERIRSISGKIKAQVSRSDATLKNLNRLSHFSDAGQEVCDLETVARLVLALSSRLAAAAAVTVQLIPPVTPLQVGMDPFSVAHMVFMAQKILCTGAGGGETIVIDFLTAPRGIRFFLPETLAQAQRQPAGLETLSRLCESTGATLDLSEESLALVWTKDEDRCPAYEQAHQNP